MYLQLKVATIKRVQEQSNAYESRELKSNFLKLRTSEIKNLNN